MLIPLNFVARNYQAEALEALDNGVSLAVFCWARRGGKDYTCFSYAVKKMVESPINVVIVWPTKKQGYDNFWTAIDNNGVPILDAIPKSLIAQQTNSATDMHVTLKNGSTLSLLGATDPDSLRGANAKIYIFSEFVDIPIAAYDVIKPIVAVNGGQIIIQSTPKLDGISGGTFKILFDRAKKHPNQFASRVTAREFLSEDILQDLRDECIEKNGNDFFWRQEYLCDWGQASSSAYYAHILQQLRKRRGIGHFPHDPAHPVYTAWDLGTSDSTAIVFFQVIGKKTRIIDYYETHDMAYSATVRLVLSKPYNYGWHFLPHDASVRDIELVERHQKLIEYGLVNSSILMRESREAGINRTVEGLSASTEFNEGTSKDLIRKLTLYKRKFNPLTGDYIGPEHGTESHAADCVKYMFKAIEDEFNKETGEFMYSPDMAQDTYETDDFAMPAAYNPY